MGETTFKKLGKGLIELLDGYPDYRFFGKIEYYLKNNQSSLDILKRDGIIELASKKEEEEFNKKLTQKQWDGLKAEGKSKPTCWYRLTAKGVDLAISMINLKHSQSILNYTKETIIFNQRIVKLTIILTLLGIGSLFFVFAQLIIDLWV